MGFSALAKIFGTKIFSKIDSGWETDISPSFIRNVDLFEG